VQYWLSKGVQPSATVHNLLVKEKILDAKKIHVSKISKKKQAEIDAAQKAAQPAPAEVKPEPAGEAPPHDGAAEQPAAPAAEEKPAE